MSLKFHEVKYGKAPSAKDNPKKARPNPRPGPSAEERTKRKCLRWMRSLECPEATFKDKPHAWWTITIEGEGSYYFWGPKDKEDAEYMADYLFMLADFESGTRWSLTPGMGDRFGPAKPFEAWEREFKPGLEREIEEADKESAAGTSGSSRANPWKASVRSTYGSLEELRSYDRNYGIVERLGYRSAKELWDDNPIIGGSVHPEDLRVMRKGERLPRSGSHLPPPRRNPEGPSLGKRLAYAR